MKHKLTITPRPPHGITGDIHLDGTKISDAVSGVTVAWRAGELPKVTLDLNVFVEPVELGDPRICLPEQTKQALIALGWTPPEDNA